MYQETVMFILIGFCLTTIITMVIMIVFRKTLPLLKSKKRKKLSDDNIPKKESKILRSYGYKDNKTIDYENLNLFRELPFDGDIFLACAIPYLNNLEFDYANILGAIFLKMLRDRHMTIREDGVIDLEENAKIDNDIERKLYGYLTVSGVEGYLKISDFISWCNNNSSVFLAFLKNIIDEAIYNLKDKKHIYKRTSIEECSKENVMDDYIYEETKKYFGLRRFLQEFSSIDKKEVSEVKIWEEYLIFAYLFGMADEVSKKISLLDLPIDPDFNFFGVFKGNMENLDNLAISSIVESSREFGIGSTSSGNLSKIFESSSTSSSIGSLSSSGGGFSSGGGGGGSFGGGGSMGGR